MQQVCQLIILQFFGVQSIEICLILLRICRLKFEDDTLCLLSPSRVKEVQF